MAKFVSRPRIEREKKTVRAMIGIYCGDNHGTLGNFCPECTELLEYTLLRLEKCPFSEGKTTCTACPIHCYRPDMRARIRTVMRYVGPRMIWRHPILALLHLMDGRRKEPI